MGVVERRAWAREVADRLADLPEPQARALRLIYFGQDHGGARRRPVPREADLWTAGSAGLVRLGGLLQSMEPEPEPGRVDAVARTGPRSSQGAMAMSDESYADMLEALFARFEDRHDIVVIEQVAASCRDELDAQVPLGARLELIERRAGQRLAELPPSPAPG